jgi:dipeptide/tripeptide permease
LPKDYENFVKLPCDYNISMGEILPNLVTLSAMNSISPSSCKLTIMSCLWLLKRKLEVWLQRIWKEKTMTDGVALWTSHQPLS